MSIFLSAFTCITNPDLRQDPWRASVDSVLNWADEVVIVDGSNKELHEVNKLSYPQAKWIHYEWPFNWSWAELPKHYNLALQNCTGDWAIRFDVDYVFPESWKDEVKQDFEKLGDKRLASFHKLSAVCGNRFYAKGNFPFAINRKFDDMCFGKAEVETDLVVPIIYKTLGEVPKGSLVPKEDIARTSLHFFNYDHTFKTKENIAKSFYEFSRARKIYFGSTNWGDSPEQSFEVFMTMMRERLIQCTMTLNKAKQPIFIHKELDNLTPEKFGYNGFGML